MSPITSRPIIDACVKAGVAVMPGALTPTEIAAAWDAGADLVKVFPARGLGPNYIKDILAPMPYLKLMPTGGVDLNNLQSYFAAGAVAAGIGGNLMDAAAVAAATGQLSQPRLSNMPRRLDMRSHPQDQTIYDVLTFGETMLCFTPPSRTSA